MNKYDLEHVVAHHPRMTADEWRDLYDKAWSTYYTPEHIQTILRRGVACGMGPSRLMAELFFYSAAHRIEHMHPLQAGAFRLKYRHDRRPGLPVEPVWAFYPKYLWEIVSKHLRLAGHWIMLDRMLKRAKREQKVRPYTDLAITMPTEDETETLAMFTHNEAARSEVAHQRKVAALTHGGRPVAAQQSA
jgi:hypothetical protein